MGTNNTQTERAQRERLIRTFTAESALSCVEAEPRIAELAQAEAFGQEVDDDPKYAEALLHLETCAACLAAYQELSQDLYALVQDAVPQPVAATLTPAVEKPQGIAHRLGQATVQVWNAAARVFEVSLNAPSAPPSPLVLRGSHTLFEESVPYVVGAPAVTVTAVVGDDEVALRVVVDDPQQHAQWRVRLVAGEQALEQTTDDGVALFPAISRAGWDTVTITIAEIEVRNLA